MSLSYECIEYVQVILYDRLKGYSSSTNPDLDFKYWNELYTEMFKVYDGSDTQKAFMFRTEKAIRDLSCK